MSDTKPTGGPAFPRSNRAFVEMSTGNLTNEQTDGMSLRQYAAITLRVPDSGEEWLDQMIRQSLRDEMAGKAMQSIMVNMDMETKRHWATMMAKGTNGIVYDSWSADAYKMADSVLKAREQ